MSNLKSTKRANESDGLRLRALPTALACLLLLCTVAALSGCGEGGKGSGAASEAGQEAIAENPEVAEAKARAKLQAREAGAIKREEAELAIKRKKLEARLARRAAERGSRRRARTHVVKHHARTQKAKTHTHKRSRKSKESSGKKSSGNESAGEKAAREQLAAEEAKEAASYKRRAKSESEE
jgi:hypothetical protein